MQKKQLEALFATVLELYNVVYYSRGKIVYYMEDIVNRGGLVGYEYAFFTSKFIRYNIDYDVRFFQSLLIEPLLSVELVPGSCWFTNVRSVVEQNVWNKLRRNTYDEADRICEICGGVGRKHPVEGHEVWIYDDEKKIQKLKRLTALCPDCHSVKHMGRSKQLGKGELATKHLAQVNEWTEAYTNEYLEKVWETWRERSQHEWKLDLRWLESQGVVVDVNEHILKK